jgi:hypothetical protein
VIPVSTQEVGAGVVGRVGAGVVGRVGAGVGAGVGKGHELRTF